jgi:gluconate 2-dehydrogenase gamma chain
MPLTRRQAAAAALAALPAPAQPLFSPAQIETITFLADFFIPPDDTPGAGQAGAANYLQRQLAGPLSRFLPNWRDGLVALDRAAAGSFLSLPTPARSQLLEDIGNGKFPALRNFFDMALDHVLQSYFGDPKYGGNANEASWKAAGIQDLMHSRHRRGSSK